MASSYEEEGSVLSAIFGDTLSGMWVLHIFCVPVGALVVLQFISLAVSLQFPWYVCLQGVLNPWCVSVSPHYYY